MNITIFWSIVYFALSLIILFEIRKFTNNICWTNIINIAKFIFFQLVITSYLLLFWGEEPTFNQSLFIAISFFCAMSYLIFDYLKSGDIASFIVGLMLVLVMAFTILYFCLLVVSHHNISNMIKAFMIFLVFTLLFGSLAYTKVVIKYKLLYLCYIILISFTGFVLLFAAYKYPEEASYKSVHNTIYSWGKITSFNSSDDIVQILQAALVLIGVPYIGHIIKLIIKKSTSKLDNIS
jgi:hypothetical protein